MTYSTEVIGALAELRALSRGVGMNAGISRLFNTLDDAGVFAALDEAVQSDQAEAILAESARDDLEKAVSRLGKLERVPGTDTLRPAHEHVFRSPHSDEICYGAEWCTVTYREHRRAIRKPEPETVGQEVRRMSGADEWAARARAIESIQPKGRRSHGSLAADND